MMKLSYSPTSPFVRKATALIMERGLEAQVERVPADPWDEADPLPKTNPLGKVPALTLENGQVLVDSALVCEYLDSLPGGANLYPSAGEARWRALALHSLGNGLMEAGVAWIIEKLRRPEDKRWEGWMQRQRGKAIRTLDTLEREAAAGHLAGPLTIGGLTTAIALGYLDFRFGDLTWREGRPALAAWYEEVSQRPSLRATEPKAPS